MTQVKRFAVNTAGRDFAVGDIHGHFTRLQAALDAAGFDPAVDRLFSVGDLVDRGPESLDVDEWVLRKPWFHAVRGNHEQMTVDSCASGRTSDECGMHFINGGQWFYGLSSVEHGQTSLFFHHGHKKKPTAVADVFVSKFRDVFGRTKHSYAHLGHLHHVDIKENNLMIVEQHRTLAAPDAYASRGGWISGRDAKVITYHKAYGEVGRLTINSDMLKAGAA